MSEYEYIDLIFTGRDSVGFHGMNFLAFLFGYLAATYFVGSKLSMFQAISLTVFYTICVPFPLMGMYESAKDLTEVIAGYYATYRPQSEVPKVFDRSLWVAPWVLGVTWFLSVLFMWQTRRLAKHSTLQSTGSGEERFQIK